MAIASTEPLRVALRSLHATCAGVEGSAIVSADGLVLASMLSDQVDPDRFGAMCATVLALASRMAQEVARGALGQIIIEGERGTVLLTQAGNVGVLALVASHDAPLGRLILTARNVANSLRRDEPAAEAA